MEQARRQMSHSELKTFTQCRRKWALTYYWEWGPDPATDSPVGVRHIGQRVHLALEAAYGHGLDPMRVLWRVYEDAGTERPDAASELTRERDLAEAMVEGFFQWAAEEGIDADYEVLETEREIGAELALPDGQSVWLRGKIDQLVRRVRDGAILQRDFKTVGDFSRANLLLLDTQMRLYALIMSMEAKKDDGPRVDGALYLMIRRSKRTERAKGPFYQQIPVRYNSHELNATWLRSRAVASAILDARQRLDAGADHREAAYPIPGDHCGWGCPFLAVCPLMDDGSRWEDALRSSFAHVDPYERYSGATMERIRQALG